MTETDYWEAPLGSGELNAVVKLPGSKSMTARALVIALLAKEPTVIRGALLARDTELMIAGLRELGAEVTVTEEDETTIVAVIPPKKIHGGGQIDCGLSGTVMRFLPAVAALAEGSTVFFGDPEASARPVAPLLDALTQLGAEITYGNAEGQLPFTVTGTGSLTGGTVSLDATSSSQFISALLLAAPLFESGFDLQAIGEVPSAPHIQMTVDMMAEHGVTADTVPPPFPLPGLNSHPDHWRVSNGSYTGGEVEIEPDLTNAGPFLAATLICGGQVLIESWPEQTNQPGDMWRTLLPAMGGRVGRASGGLVARGTGLVNGIDWDLSEAGELAPTAAALAALAVSPSELRGLQHLAGHETDRLTAIQTEIERLGGICEVRRGRLRISPANLHGADLETYKDHRMAMFGAIIALKVPGVRIANIETVSKTFPNFVTQWQKMLA
ncbi:MAG: 3-phosphoshikimate 1-carboxyvinyltransferase [Varibaculum sp.]|nr:3-phosphoshikimate 1-carboxyvinyltransferase [Varibaculum sp.]